jgi:3-mercaptopyruvate sulfurtransferase SseA
MGYKNVRSMASDFKAWKAAGLPTTKITASDSFD